MRKLIVLLVVAAVGAVLSGCSSGNGADFRIDPGPDASTEALTAFDEAEDGDVIEFGCGFFEINGPLLLNGLSNVTIRGCGIDDTVLSFAGSPDGNGILAQNMDGITIHDLTVVDTKDDGIRVEDSDMVTMRRIRGMWSSMNEPITAENYQTALDVTCPDFGEIPDFLVSDQNGRYALYPTDSTNVLVEDSEAIGASDAGIYVGQSEDAILRNNRAAFNVAGIEIENTNRADAFDNVAECNTAGIMIFNLTSRPFYGDQVRVFDNVFRNNNTENFAPSGFIQEVASGLGVLVLAKDQVEIRDNEIRDNGTINLLVISQQLLAFGGLTDLDDDLQINPVPDAISIRNNVFSNAGAMPDQDNDLANVMLGANDGEGAHMGWDGFLDELIDDCDFPEGVEADERGKPQYRNDPEPECRFNAYKFDDQGERIKPDFWICIEDNTIEDEGMAPRFFNFLNSAVGDEPDRDITPHRCEDRFGETLPALPPASVMTMD